ncbi:unnamed protein product [Hydatigera taeniaeformis]|uniref:WW domain-containing protein n=1 Tax=Hydatigena taeniaeformis TaxID=6205 RepID=A0A0R3X742_HYDTA|nr:unnamed protein product [Hydatigera taeniaeformis]
MPSQEENSQANTSFKLKVKIVSAKLHKHTRSTALSRIRNPTFYVEFNTTSWDAPPPSDSPTNTDHITSNRGSTSAKTGWTPHFNSRTNFNININSHIEFLIVSQASVHASLNNGAGLVVGYSRLGIRDALRNHGNNLEDAAFALDILPLPTDQSVDGTTLTSLGTLNLLLTASARAVNAAIVAVNINQRPSVVVDVLVRDTFGGGVIIGSTYSRFYVTFEIAAVKSLSLQTSLSGIFFSILLRPTTINENSRSSTPTTTSSAAPSNIVTNGSSAAPATNASATAGDLLTVPRRQNGSRRRSAPNTEGLPPHWEQRTDPSTGRTYYVDHLTKRTQWEKPQPLPSGYATITPLFLCGFTKP